MLQTIFIGLMAIMHPFYVSMTEIKHNAKEKRLEVSCRIFFDDLEHTLEKRYKVQLDILKPTDRKKVDALIADYIKNHLQIKMNGKTADLKYLGYQIEEDACWCYFEANAALKVKKLEIVNDILFAEHQSQINMLQATVNGKEKTSKLNNPDSRMVFEF